MKPIDTKTWKEFKVGDLFEKISRGTRLKKANRITGDKPLLTAGGYNNGVSEYIEKHDVLYAGTNLTIDMFGNSFVHTYPFYADDNILIFNNKKTVYILTHRIYTFFRLLIQTKPSKSHQWKT